MSIPSEQITLPRLRSTVKFTGAAGKAATFIVAAAALGVGVGAGLANSGGGSSPVSGQVVADTASPTPSDSASPEPSPSISPTDVVSPTTSAPVTHQAEAPSEPVAALPTPYAKLVYSWKVIAASDVEDPPMPIPSGDTATYKQLVNPHGEWVIAPSAANPAPPNPLGTGVENYIPGGGMYPALAKLTGEPGCTVFHEAGSNYYVGIYERCAA